MAAGSGDFLYSIGIDLSKANADLEEWRSRTVPAMMNLEPIQLRVGYSAAKTNIQNFVNYAKTALKEVPPINVSFNFAGASRSLNAFMSNFKKNASAIGELEAAMGRLQQRGQGLASAYAPFANSMTGLRSSLQGATRESEGFVAATTRGGASAEKFAQSATKGSAAVDYLGKVMIADVAKILAWGAAFEAMQGTMRFFSDAVKQAGEVQMEQTLQGLYSSTINVNTALQQATMIAREWGGNIVDIQQAIGLWTKNTNDLAAATMLAAKGEEFARSSGVETLEVYRDSVAIGTQMGLTYGQLPGMYDQIAHAALRLAEPLRGINERSIQGQEAMKDIFQGLTEAAATLSANSFRDTASIIAIVTNQIQAMGDHGEEAARQLATMFGALSQGGPRRKEWESILGVGAFKDANSLLEAMQNHLAQLMQAQADGKLGVRPAQVEALATMAKSLRHIRDLYKDISANSGGTLDLIALKEMGTYQAQVDRLKTSIQALEIAVGQQLLPSMESWVNWSASTGIPTLQAWLPGIETGARVVLGLAAAWAVLQGALKVGQLWSGVTAQIDRNNAALVTNAEAEANAMRAGFANAASMDTLEAKLATLRAQETEVAQSNQLLAEAYARLGAEAGLTAEQLARLTPEQQAAGESATAAAGLIDKETIAVKGLQMELFAAGEQMQFFTDAETKALLPTQDLATAEGVLATNGGLVEGAMGRAATGIGIMAGAAGRALAPLAAIMAGMSAVQGFGASFNANDRQLASINEAGQGQLSIGARAAGIIPGLLSGKFFSQGGMALGDLLQGKIGDALGSGGSNSTPVPAQLSWQMLQKNSPVAGQYAQAMTAWNQPGGKNQENLDAIVQLVDAYKKQTGVTNSVTDAFTRVQKQLEAMEAADKKAYAASLNKQLGAPEGDHVFADIPAKGGTGNPSGDAVHTLTSAYDALTKSKLSVAAAADTDIQAIKTEISVYGASQSLLNQLTGAYQRKIAAYGAAVAAGNQYVAGIKKLISTDEQELQSSSLTAKSRGQYTKALQQAENDYTKALGMTVDMQAKYRQALVDEETTLATYTEKTQLAAQGVTNWKTSLQQIGTQLTNTKNLAAQLTLAISDQSQINQIAVGLSNVLDTIKTKFPQATTIITALKNALAEVDAEGQKLSDTADTDATKIKSLGDAMQQIGDTLSKDNLSSVANVLGANKQTVTYLTQMSDAEQQISKYQDEINKDAHDLLNTHQSLLPEVQQLLNAQISQAQYAQEELNIKKQILPLEEQILNVRSSPLYQAWDSEIDKFGQDFGDKVVGKLFGGGGATGWLATVHQFFTGIGSDLFNNVWKQASGSITDSMFGLGKPDQQLEQKYQQLITILAQTLSTNWAPPSTALTQALTGATAPMNNLAQAIDRFTSGGGGGPSIVNAPGGAFQSGDQFGPYEQEFGISNPMGVGQSYDSANTTADNTTQIAENTANTATAVTALATAVGGGTANINNSLTVLGGGGSGSAASSSVMGLGGGGIMSLLGGLGGGGAAGGILGGLGGGGGVGGILGGLGSMLTSPAGFLTSALGIGSALGGIFGSDTGQAGTSGREEYGMMGALGGGLGGVAAALGAAGLFGMGGLGGIGIAGALSGPFAPLVIGGGLLLGGLLGSMFGDHFSVQDEPDIGEPTEDGVNYGQFVADMTGQTGSFNGNTVNPLSQYSGAQDAESRQLETDVQKVISAPTGRYPSQLVGLAKQLQALNPQDEPYGFSINSEKNDVFTLHSGAQVNVEAYMKLAQGFMQLFGQQQAQPLAPILSINGGAGFNLYNTPGLTSDEFNQFTQAGVWQGGGGGNSGPGSPPVGSPSYQTPGVGTGFGSSWTGGNWGAMGMRGSGGGSSGTSGGNVTVQLMVDGKVIAQIVNAYNAQYLLNSGKSIDQVPVLS